MDNRERILGFVPQKEIIFNDILPYAEKLDEESLLYLSEIKSNLGMAILRHEIIPEAMYWVNQLSKFIKLYGRKFSKEDHLKFVHLLFEILIIPELQPHSVQRVASLLHLLLKKVKLLTRDDLLIPWRPLYELCERTIFSSAQGYGLYLLPNTFGNSLRALIRSSRVYFSAESTQEMLDEWKPQMCPFDSTLCIPLSYLELFLCTKLPPHQHDQGFKLWFDDFIHLWQTYPAWENMMMSLFSRLARDNIGYIDWEPYIPVVFTKLMRSLNLPGVNACSHDISSSVVWIASMLGGGSKCQTHIKHLFKAIESYYHPSNTGKWMVKLQRLLNRLPQAVVARLHRERYAKVSWETEVPANHHLTDEDVTEFVLSMKPVALLSIFSKVSSMDGALALQNLAALRPEIIIPSVIDRLYSSLETLTEPHRLTAAIHCVAFLARSMVRRDSNFPEGPSHVMPLLMGALPGIDSNDMKKCLLTFQFVSVLASLILLVDCSKEIDEIPNLTEMQRELCLATASFEDFILQFMDRCFLLIENSNFSHSSFSDRNSDPLNIEENIIGMGLSASFRSLLIQCSPSIYKCALQKLYTYLTSHIFEVRIAGKYAAAMCRSAVKAKPETAVQLFLPHFCKSIMALTEDKEVQEEEVLDNELLFSLLILSEVVNCDGQYILPYNSEIQDVLRRTLNLKCRDGYLITCCLLRNALKSLTMVYAIDFCNISDFQARCEKDDLHLLIEEWGNPGDLDNLGMKYHIPSDEELNSVQMIFDLFFTPQLEFLLQVAKEEIHPTRGKVQNSLAIVLNFLQGASTVIPAWSAQPLKLRDSFVPMHCNCVQECGAKEVSFGKDIRRSVVDVTHQLLDHMMKTREDDTKSLLVIVKIYQLAVFHWGISEEEFDVRWKGFQEAKKALGNKLHGRKQHTRMFLVDRACLQHELRVLSKHKSYFTDIHALVMRDILKLSVSHYSDVRNVAQKVLHVFFKNYSLSYQVILPDLLEILSKNAVEFHEEFKGVLYILLGQKHRFLLTSRHWELIEKLWPSLVLAKYSEKLSIIRLQEQISLNLQKNLDAIQIELRVPVSVLEKAKVLLSASVPAVPLLSDEELTESANALMEKSVISKRMYYSLVHKLVQSIEDGNLHWRQHHLALVMLLVLVRQDIRLPASAVHVFASHLVHDIVAIRRVAISAVCAILKQQKQKHPLIELDPSTVNVTEIAVHPLLEKLLVNGRPSNLWMQYNSLCFPDTHSAWNDRHFVHKMPIGFYGWPKPLKIYAPDSEQPKIDRNYEDLKKEEVPIYDSFSRPEFIDKLITYYSLETHEKFDCGRCDLFKGLFRNFGDTFLPTFVDHLKKLVADKQESSQRCAAEILSGILRGCKHWGFDKICVLKEEIIPILRTVMKNSTHETLLCWGTCVANISVDRDPNKYYWLFELLMEKPAEGENLSSALESNWLYILSCCLMHQEWRVCELLYRCLEYLKPRLSHPYMNVRIEIANLLSSIFIYDAPFQSESQVLVPKKEPFLNSILPDLSILESAEPNSHCESKNNIEAQQSTTQNCNNNHVKTSSDDTERSKAKHLLQTVCSWIQKIIQSSLNVAPPEVFKLLPVLCEMKHDSSDDCVQRSCILAISVLGQAYLPTDSIRTAVTALKQISQSGSWHARTASVSFVQQMVSSNLFTLVQNEDMLSDVKNIVLSHMRDERVEVREAAAEALGGLLHCEVLKVSDHLLSTFKAKCILKLRRSLSSAVGRERGPVLTPEDICERHCGILGLCACINAFPYDVPDFMPDILVLLGNHVHDPEPIQTTVKKTFTNFRRTHQDSWRDHKLKFTDDQLAVITDLLVSPNYYA